jgi:hypothetical protein
MLVRINPSIILCIIFLALFAAVGCGQPSSPSSPSVNQKPVVTAINGPAELKPGTKGEFSCIAYDPDGDIAEYDWSCTDGSFLSQGEKATYLAPDVGGELMIMVTVKDSRGAYSMNTRGIRITATPANYSGDKPVVLNIQLGDDSHAVDNVRVRQWSTVLVECSIDGFSQNLTYTWTVTGGKLQSKGLAEGTATKAAWIAPGGNGNYQLVVTVSDASGKSGKGIVNFTVFCCGS